MGSKFITVTVEGNDLHVLADRVFAVGTSQGGTQMVQGPDGLPMQQEVPPSTLVSIEGLGTVPVEEEVEEVLARREAALEAPEFPFLSLGDD